MAGITSRPPQPRVNKAQRMTNASFAKAGRPIPGSPQAMQQMPPQQAPMQRVSPGMYRNDQGNLQRGNQMPPQQMQQQRPMGPMAQAGQQAVQNIGWNGGVMGGMNPKDPMQPGQQNQWMQGMQQQPWYGQSPYQMFGGQQGGYGMQNAQGQQMQNMGQYMGQMVNPYLKGY